MNPNEPANPVSPQPSTSPQLEEPLQPPQQSSHSQVIAGGDNLPPPARKNNRKILTIIAVAALGIGLLVAGFFGYQVVFGGGNKEVRKASDTFMAGYMEGDVNKLRSVSAREISSSWAAIGANTFFEGADYRDMIVGPKDGHEKAVVLYSLKPKSGVPVSEELYLMIALFKTNGKWMVHDLKSSSTKPDINLDVGSYVDPDDEDAASSGTNVDEKAENTRRTNDLKAIQQYLEVYFNDYGNYPTLTKANSPGFLSGFDALAAKPTENAYSYEPKAADGNACDNQTKKCVTYTLTAIQSDGKPYTLKAIN